MKFNRQKIIRRSRDKNFLFKAVMVIGLVTGIIGFAVSTLTFGVVSKTMFSLDSPEKRTEDFEKELSLLMTDLTTEELAGAIRYSDYEDSAEAIEELDEMVERSTVVPDSERALLKLLVRAIHGSDVQQNSARQDLQNSVAAGGGSSLRFVEEFYADSLAKSGDVTSAISHYQSENKRFESALHSRMRVLALLQQQENEEELRRIYRFPEYEGESTLSIRMRLAVEFGDYGYLFKTVIEHDLGRFKWWPAVLALISASIWFVIIGQFGGLARHQIAVYLVSVVLGIVSTVLTLYCVILQEELLGQKFHPYNQGTIDQLIYCIAGIGLREELLKLLCFIPIAIFLRKRNDDLTALICASMVGLGFAFLENLGYFGSNPGFTPWARFLTANFLHAALTGVVGLAFYRMIRRRGRGWENFLADFLLMVVAHGMYDAVLMMPILGQYSFFGMLLVFAGVAFRFFDSAEELQRTNSYQAISPLGIFVIGSALLAGILFIAVCVGMPFVYALTQYLMSLAGVGVIMFIFINRFRNA